MVSETCSFLTSRLLVKEWHSLSSEEWTEKNLASVVAGMLTAAVTQSLPPGWQGPFTVDRAAKWIEERDREGTTLLVVDRSDEEPVGLVILFETADDGLNEVELRLGYLLAENGWGKGLATELLLGFVEWCRLSNIASIVGGVANENVASQRVLEKAGFVCDMKVGEVGPEELLYRLILRQ
jgi:ribosomal-protein-alanine N-acetyltransferase